MFEAYTWALEMYCIFMFIYSHVSSIIYNSTLIKWAFIKFVKLIILMVTHNIWKWLKCVLYNSLPQLKITYITICLQGVKKLMIVWQYLFSSQNHLKSICNSSFCALQIYYYVTGLLLHRIDDYFCLFPKNVEHF